MRVELTYCIKLTVDVDTHPYAGAETLHAKDLELVERLRAALDGQQDVRILLADWAMKSQPEEVSA